MLYHVISIVFIICIMSANQKNLGWQQSQQTQNLKKCHATSCCTWGKVASLFCTSTTSQIPRFDICGRWEMMHDLMWSVNWIEMNVMVCDSGGWRMVRITSWLTSRRLDILEQIRGSDIYEHVHLMFMCISHCWNLLDVFMYFHGLLYFRVDETKQNSFAWGISMEVLEFPNFGFLHFLLDLSPGGRKSFFPWPGHGSPPRACQGGLPVGGWRMMII